MLIQKSLKQDVGSIVGFKLITGEEIVAKIVELSDKGFVISKPCSVIPGERGLGLMQTMITTDINTNVLLKNEHILMFAPVIADIEKHYIKTTSGIALV